MEFVDGKGWLPQIMAAARLAVVTSMDEPFPIVEEFWRAFVDHDQWYGHLVEPTGARDQFIAAVYLSCLTCVMGVRSEEQCRDDVYRFAMAYLSLKDVISLRGEVKGRWASLRDDQGQGSVLVSPRAPVRVLGDPLPVIAESSQEFPMSPEISQKSSIASGESRSSSGSIASRSSRPMSAMPNLSGPRHRLLRDPKENVAKRKQTRELNEFNTIGALYQTCADEFRDALARACALRPQVKQTVEEHLRPKAQGSFPREVFTSLSWMEFSTNIANVNSHLQCLDRHRNNLKFGESAHFTTEQKEIHNGFLAAANALDRYQRFLIAVVTSDKCDTETMNNLEAKLSTLRKDAEKGIIRKALGDGLAAIVADSQSLDGIMLSLFNKCFTPVEAYFKAATMMAVKASGGRKVAQDTIDRFNTAYDRLKQMTSQQEQEQEQDTNQDRYIAQAKDIHETIVHIAEESHRLLSSILSNGVNEDVENNLQNVKEMQLLLKNQVTMLLNSIRLKRAFLAKYKYNPISIFADTRIESSGVLAKIQNIYTIRLRQTATVDQRQETQMTRAAENRVLQKRLSGIKPVVNSQSSKQWQKAAKTAAKIAKANPGGRVDSPARPGMGSVAAALMRAKRSGAQPARLPN